MPPKKKARVSRTVSPTPASQPSSKNDEQLRTNDDLWTDEEEIGLFKGLITWKPTGIHKHFRIVQLHQFLLDNNYIDPGNEHTRPQGIWRKLNGLYHLDALDQREDARQLSDVEFNSDKEDSDEDDEDDDDDVYSLAANKIHNQDFELDGKSEGPEFTHMMWDRRIASNKQRRDESPQNLPEINMAENPPVRFTPTLSIEPSETAATSSSRTTRGTRGRRSGGRAASGVAASRRSARHAESTHSQKDEEEEDESSSSEEDEGDEEEEGDENDDDEEVDKDTDADGDSKQSTPAPRRSGRSRGGSRPRGRGRRR